MNMRARQAHPSAALAHPDHPNDALAPLDELRRTDLEKLNRAAELQTRVDRKYILPLSDLPTVLATLPAGAEVLEIGGRTAQRYASQYYDTPELDSYFGAARGRRRRFKVRSRSYLDSGDSFLEVKTRGSRSATVKDRVPVSGDALTIDAVDHASELLADAGIPDAADVAGRLRPVLVTRYRRTTVLLPAAGASDPSRATVDVELTWTTTGGAHLALAGTAIIETKSGQRAGALDRALWRAGHRPASLSKYGTGMAALNPGLPAHKWRRVLERHFATSPY